MNTAILNEILDPWDSSSNDFILKLGINLIKGPIYNPKDKNSRHIIEFIYENKGENIFHLTTVKNESSDFKHLYLKIYENETIIENISKSSIYRGSEYVILGLQIIYRLFGSNKNYKCKLVDSSFFICDRKMNVFQNIPNISKKEEIQHKMITLLRYGKTFYMPLGFNPYNKNSLNNSNEIISELVSKLWDISWAQIDEYMELMIESVKSNKYQNNIMIRNYTKWKNYWNNIYNYWKIFYNKYLLLSPTPFRSFIFFNYDECHEFINWLELYSLKYHNFNLFIFNNIPNNNTQNAGIKLFKKLRNTVNNVYWINNNIKSQSIVSIYNKLI
jgi:hypothetical protein